MSTVALGFQLSTLEHCRFSLQSQALYQDQRKSTSPKDSYKLETNMVA